MKWLTALLLYLVVFVSTCYGADLETLSPTLTGDWTFNNTVAQEIGTIGADDATPDVSGSNVFVTSANTGATAITDLDNPTVGQIVVIVGGSATNSSTIADSGNFKLNTAWTAGLDDALILLVKADNYYVELGRVDN